MNKKYSLAFFTLIIVGLFSLFSINISAQNKTEVTTEKSTKTCSGEKFVLPNSVSRDRKGIKNYISIISLPPDERPKAFSDLSPSDAATVFKLHLAAQFVLRPGLSQQQQELILDSMSKVAAENYDTNNPNRSLNAKLSEQEFHARVANLFSRREAYDIFFSIGDDVKQLAFLQRYDQVLDNQTYAARINLFVSGSKEQRSEFMRAQMIFYLATSSLRPNQAAFFAKMIHAAVPDAFELSTNPKNEETIKLKAEAEGLFSKQEMFTFFMSFGIHNIDPDKEAKANLNAELQPARCLCNWYCAPCYGCNVTSSSCTETTSGCGWKLSEACTNSCFFAWSECY